MKSMNNKELFKIFAEFSKIQVNKSLNALDMIYNEISNGFDREFEEIKKMKFKTPPDDDEIYFYLRNREGESFLGTEVFGQYMIVATYSLFEKALKHIFSWTNKLSENEIKFCYKDQNLKKILENKFGIDYQTLNKSAEIAELRFLNNCIKHDGKVNNDLAQSNNKWQENQPIESVYDDFRRLKDTPIQFLTDLINKIENQL